MKRLYILIVLSLLLNLLGCSTETTDSTDYIEYDGSDLEVAVIGDIPNLNEEKVKFTNITFEEMEKLKPKPEEIDAVIITKENLIKASQGKYAKVYKNTNIPFFFIESSKSYVPFVYEKYSYEKYPEVDSLIYATGVYFHKEELTHWGYGLYNDKLNDENIRNVYIRIFSTIDDVKNMSN
ncbi:hypothetical protein [Pseudalkalibacillus hwajinpoensis]|uniref:Transcription elongation factor GreAB n=1 Tax=Guptibacillus hwajinpoensis TaxID=208199 RepID=A0A4U1MID4_9BACL|nr:hypothetical protein [Pseudalkalibacillus hwajinpoensis]TKD70783.1 hypothetical protein FBF83_09220 [Pseudalkalibacillus hwajinpoensis]